MKKWMDYDGYGRWSAASHGTVLCLGTWIFYVLVFVWQMVVSLGNCFLHHITASDSSGKDEIVLKFFFFQNMCFGFFFFQTKFYITDFFIWNEFFIFVFEFSFLKYNNFFSNFFSVECIIFNSRFFCPK